MKILLFLLLFNNSYAEKHKRPAWKRVKVGKCKETMREWILRKDAIDLKTNGCKIIGGVYEWVYYEKKPQQAFKKNIDIDHILPQAWFRDNCFYNKGFKEFEKAYNEEMNLVATHHAENADKSDWVCNKKNDKFLKNITEEVHKRLCKQQYNFCLELNKNYNNACGDKCNELIYKR